MDDYGSMIEQLFGPLTQAMKQLAAHMDSLDSQQVVDDIILRDGIA